MSSLSDKNENSNNSNNSNNDSFQLKQIQEAAKLAFDNNDYFVQILDTIISISLAQPLNNSNLQFHCLNFIYKSFVLKKIKSFNLRLKNSLKLIDLLLKFLINDEIKINLEKINYNLIEKSIEIFASTYSLMFLQLIKFPNNEIWLKIIQLKDFLLSKWLSSYPLLPLNKETDLSRSIGCKISLTKLIGKIIQTQLPYPPNSNLNSFDLINDNYDDDNLINDSFDISISLVNKNHPFLYTSTLNNQGQILIDNLLNLLNNDSLLTTSFFSILITILMNLFKLRPNFLSNKILNFILAYESQFKNPSKFDLNNKLKIRLIRRFNDRIDKILMSMLLNRGFIEKDLPLKSRFSNKLSYMIEKSNKQKKIGILSDENDINDDENNNNNNNNENENLTPRIKRAKIDNNSNLIDFYDESTIVKAENFKSIYTLINPNDELANFDISQIPNEFINNIVILGLSKINSNKLNKGLEIISSRYLDLYKRIQSREDELAAATLSNALASKNNIKNSSKYDNINTNNKDNDEDSYDPSSSDLIKKEKKSNKNNIDDNDDDDDDDEDFDFELESKKFELPIPKILDPNEKKDQIKLIVDNFIKSSTLNLSISNENSQNKEPSKIKNSWIKILSRLATRGTEKNPEISNYIRESLFNYFKEDIKNRIDGVIEWLNEEYYNDFIVLKKDKSEISNSNYMKYTSLVMDYLIPFLEPNDRNIFIRLLSELPYLNLTLISKLKSICNDPIRSKIGFQPLLYLIMFRPPVFNDCIKFLTELYKDAIEKKNDQLKNDCLGYLKKYKPDVIPSLQDSNTVIKSEPSESPQK